MSVKRITVLVAFVVILTSVGILATAFSGSRQLPPFDNRAAIENLIQEYFNTCRSGDFDGIDRFLAPMPESYKVYSRELFEKQTSHLPKTPSNSGLIKSPSERVTDQVLGEMNSDSILKLNPRFIVKQKFTGLRVISYYETPGFVSVKMRYLRSEKETLYEQTYYIAKLKEGTAAWGIFKIEP